MNLREWNSNSKEMISSIPKRFRSKDRKHVKVLGLIWDIDRDQLHLKVNLGSCDLNAVKTKRDVLKVMASVYDPCGFAVPVVLPAKLFFQKLWKEKIKWDVKLSDRLLKEWSQIASKFSHISNIYVNRYYAQNLDRKKNSDIKFELHCFTDSSLEGYAAVVYLRSSLHTNNVVNFVIGKSRLVPLKDQINLQIPRLELLGVLIGCRLLSYVVKFFRLKVSAQFLWTDSQIVLSWYKTEKLLPPFVSRRINEIKQNKSIQVRYVPSKLNPSDVGTRSDRVDSYKRWLRGPDFLLGGFEQWPIVHNYTDDIKIHTYLAGEGLTNPMSVENPKDASDSDKIETMIANDNHECIIDDETKRILKIQKDY